MFALLCLCQRLSSIGVVSHGVYEVLLAQLREVVAAADADAAEVDQVLQATLARALVLSGEIGFCEQELQRLARVPGARQQIIEMLRRREDAHKERERLLEGVRELRERLSELRRSRS